MLSGLMGRIDAVVDAAAAALPIALGKAFKFTITPLTAALPAAVQIVADNNAALMQPGATVTAAGGKIVIEGRAAMDWEHVGDFIDSLGQVIYSTVPYSDSKFEADIFTEAAPSPTPTPTPTPTSAPGAPAASGSSPLVWLAVGAAALFFFSKGK